MGLDRRKFFKLAGMTALGLTLKPGWELISGNEVLAAVDRDPSPTGKRLAMVIDIRKCQETENCTKCVDACNEVHNIPNFGNKKDEIKWIWMETFEGAFAEQDHPYLEKSLTENDVLVLCNHCNNPPCVRVCPTQATWQRPDGIVMMDWHRCIGCRYCIVACPYGARSFNWRDPRPFIKEIRTDFPTRMRGVVEKCTFCERRLDEGLQPACVEACTSQAMTFGNLEDPESKVRELLQGTFTIRRKPELGTNPQVYYIVR